MKNIVKFGENFLLVLVLFGIISISAITAFSLNPTINDNANVAGINASGGSLLEFKNILEKQLVYELAKTDSNAEYKIILSEVMKGVNSYEFISLVNENNFDSVMKINTTVNGYTDESFELSLINNSGEEVFIFPNDEVILNIPKYSENQYSLKFYSEKNLNYITQVVIDLNF